MYGAIVLVRACWKVDCELVGNRARKLGGALVGRTGRVRNGSVSVNVDYKPVRKKVRIR